MMNEKVAIITGASRGIGAATAKLFAEHGAKVVVNYANNKKAAQEVVESIREKGGESIAIQADVRNQDEVDSLVKETILQFGKVDVLVNNAAISFAMKSLCDMEWDEFRTKLEEEVKAAFIATKSVLPFMKEQKYGKLVYISSNLSHLPLPNFIAHGTAKGALNSFVKYVAQELGPFHITANVVAPAMVETDATSQNPVEIKEQVKMSTPLGRIAKPEDIARSVLFFASDQSAFVTGTYAPVSGGMEMNN
ncbi:MULTISPECIES: SDR family NAD(P)-dependent oxidoreductase [Bacillus cereus group]|uniref:SDR family NAD(P)-dependent oxidoreductase n=1 Tax=Bacillus cereus group TaxID=86661 RepID=UPI000BEC8033|nr:MULTISPECIES: glucose 1-dehydrogenase [Bacillus cereus group]PDY16896.1 short-chain dehydrogenase [Bacillus cereus]PET65121.1 short-chain dehydrogenase [Bacillus cereus]PEU50742.1 short-chain dehydrogenase [Bacillus cereus]PEX73714.1 short-chain dehydrogenase [Bacillus cereus]PEZ29737.1 short-chain dehydrogenase [Bacillus cereus]